MIPAIPVKIKPIPANPGNAVERFSSFSIILSMSSVRSLVQNNVFCPLDKAFNSWLAIVMLAYMIDVVLSGYFTNGSVINVLYMALTNLAFDCLPHEHLKIFISQ